MLLGLKTRIAKTVSDLLQHQRTITHQIVSEISQQHSTSRLTISVPTFLRAVASRLSAHFWKKKRKWENFVNRMKKINCELSSIYCSNNTFTCHVVDWTYTCLFFTSNRLPCCHLMHVAGKWYGFKMLPAMSIRERWSTFVALNVKDDIAADDIALQPIVSMSKLKLPKGYSKSLNGNYEGAQKFDNSLAESRNQVAFVRLRRYEKANQVVLSSAEMYSYVKAVLEPLLQQLCELSSAYFYQELNAWKETEDIGLQRKNTEDATKEDVDVSESEMYSILDPADAIGTVSIMQALETSRVHCFTDDDSDDDGIPLTQPTEVPRLPPRLITHGQVYVGAEKASSCSPHFNPVPVTRDFFKSDESNVHNGAQVSTGSSLPMRQVDIVSVPKPKSRGRSRSATKQLRQTKHTAGLTRIAVHQYPCDLIA
ncbi:LOW QUALITY PROTEIN: Hypothetical protein PHPALM_431 [Phytophthora palmivora]|uniref:SWIM-type domain-containing protein n=1 Tax=Phytophthora palmivora TaxID=4796 RepID=A0A2P4YUV5_9STRA|nr:LOW QUALITY PROTEIN: Hypothetical protein PHPALM_431 [Phytophthora palmivora]